MSMSMGLEESMLHRLSIVKIERDLKNKTLRDNISIELEANGNVIIRSFPNDNEK